MKKNTLLFTVCLGSLLCGWTQLSAQEVLPFPEPQSASVAGKTLKDSKHQWRQAEKHLPDDAPNIVIFMTDDAGFANSSTFGGPVNMPTLDRLANTGISYNRFHTTAQCSATRASLLTGRNHHRVGAGQIAEFASDWDGYAGVIPKTTATIPQVLSYYGYNTAAFGKWHNTPVTNITKLGPFDRWPTGMGFDYFYGFLAGETSQYDSKERLSPATVTLTVNGKEVAQMRMERSVPSVHTASETFDVGKDLGSPVALDYYDRAPFEFSGKIEKIHISYVD